NRLAWQLVKLPGWAMSDYRKAVSYSEEACQLETQNKSYLNTLGVAYYRVGSHEKALATLLRSDQLNQKEIKSSIPADLAFLAMTHHCLGHVQEAHTYLQRLREQMKDSRWTQDAEARDFLREAEALLAKARPPGDINSVP